MSILKRLVPIAFSRCPHCCHGAAFSSFLKMNRTCPHCGILFEREHGYFLNSMFIGYALNVIIFALAFGLAYLIGGDSFRSFVFAAILMVLMIPVVFRYARIIWMHVDEIVDPREEQVQTE